MPHAPDATKDRSRLIVALGRCIYALDPRSGDALWSTPLDLGFGVGAVEIVVSKGIVLVSGDAESLVCLDYKTGRMFWQAETSTSGRASIVIEGDHIFLAKGGEVNCFDWRGKRLWVQPLPGAGMGRAAIGFPDNVRQADEAG